MLDFQQCWQAVCARDATQDGRFVFAVRSTGIFCRPSCPARRPLEKHTAFFLTPEDAREAGFRPCRRCSPQGQSPAEAIDRLISQVCQLLENSEHSPTLAQLAAHTGFSASHLTREFKRRTGMTPKAWVKARRSNAQLTTLRESKRPAVSQLYYAISSCPLGYVLLARTPKGVCALLFADTPDDLQQELAERFPAAHREQDQVELGTWMQEVLQQLHTPERAAQLPLDLQGTAFQQRVWQALQNIPVGQTRNYSQLAVELGSHPRAIARACASNPVGLLVPCHRVIGANGALSGYRWGLQRKAALLAAEAL
jgi:AraC family transcriptional regulator of adaptative response/methylated-DNA-[protein]-cysteine methyltransferase